MDSGERPRLQRLATDSTGVAKAHIHDVDVGSREIGDRSGTEVRVEVTVEHRSGLANRRRRPTSLGDREPPFQQLPHRSSRRDARPSAGTVGHRGELAFSLCSVTAHRL